jgi:hypothetical protein
MRELTTPRRKSCAWKEGLFHRTAILVQYHILMIGAAAGRRTEVYSGVSYAEVDHMRSRAIIQVRAGVASPVGLPRGRIGTAGGGADLLRGGVGRAGEGVVLGA